MAAFRPPDTSVHNIRLGRVYADKIRMIYVDGCIVVCFLKLN